MYIHGSCVCIEIDLHKACVYIEKKKRVYVEIYIYEMCVYVEMCVRKRHVF